MASGAACSTLCRCNSQGPAHPQHLTGHTRHSMGWAQISMNVQERHMSPCPFMLTSTNPSRQLVPPWKPLYMTSPKEINGWLQGHHGSLAFLRVVEDGELFSPATVSMHHCEADTLQQMPLTSQGRQSGPLPGTGRRSRNEGI